MAQDQLTHSKLDGRQMRLVLAAGLSSVVVASTLVGLKTWAWLTTDSVALLSSLADSILDLMASVITLFAVRIAAEPADREHRFGHGKSEAVAGLVQSLIVTVSAAYVGVQAVRRLLDPQEITAPGIGLGVMGVSMVLTISLVSFQRHVMRRTGSMAINADAVHYQADILTNVAVLAAIAVNVWIDWYLADPILGLIVVGLILASVRDIAMKSLDVLLDRELPASARKKIRAIAMRHESVLGIHDLRTRSSGYAFFIQFHIELDPRLTLDDAHRISDEVELALKDAFPRAEVLIHADPFGLAEERDDF